MTTLQPANNTAPHDWELSWYQICIFFVYNIFLFRLLLTDILFHYLYLFINSISTIFLCYCPRVLFYVWVMVNIFFIIITCNWNKNYMNAIFFKLYLVKLHVMFEIIVVDVFIIEYVIIIIVDIFILVCCD